MVESDVLVGKDDWLFHGQGSNRWIDYFTGVRQLQDTQVSAWMGYVASCIDLVSAVGAKFLFIVTPEKHSILHEYLPSGIIPGPQRPGVVFADMASKFAEFVNIESIFFSHNDKKRLFIKTDSHWSDFGAYVAYSELARKMDCFPLVEGVEFFFTNKVFVGDLGRKCVPTRRSLTGEVQLGEASGRMVSNGIENIGKFEMPDIVNENKQTDVLVFGNSFLWRGLGRFLHKHFVNVAFAFLPFVDMSLVRQLSPKWVILQLTERFLSISPLYEEHRIPFSVRMLSKIIRQKPLSQKLPLYAPVSVRAPFEIYFLPCKWELYCLWVERYQTDLEWKELSLLAKMALRTDVYLALKNKYGLLEEDELFTRAMLHAWL